MAAQVNFFCFLMFFFCLACNMVPENWHICVNKGTYQKKVSCLAQTSFTAFGERLQLVSDRLSSAGRKFAIRWANYLGPTNELHSLNKSNETGLD